MSQNDTVRNESESAMNLLIASGLKERQCKASHYIDCRCDGYNQAVSELESLRPDVDALAKIICRLQTGSDFDKCSDVTKESWKYDANKVINSMPQWVKKEAV